jgi:putative phosphoribosyl transferase
MYTFGTEIELPTETNLVRGHLFIPEQASGVVIVAASTPKDRESARSKSTIAELHQARLGTVLVHRVEREERHASSDDIDPELVGRRLIEVTRWFRRRKQSVQFPVGYLGIGTTVAGMLWAAGDAYNNVDAVVSIGRRPDLAGPRLTAITAPTLFIVFESDHDAIRYNTKAQGHLHCDSDLKVIPGETVFADDESRWDVALAANWFVRQFASGSGSTNRTVANASVF